MMSDMVSTRDVIDGSLPDGTTGVHWNDTDWTECLAHLTSPDWAGMVEASDEPTGVVLTGDDVVCDMCAERDRESGS